MPNDQKSKEKTGNVISLKKAREEMTEEKRRKYERVLFKNILGAYTVIEGEGLKAIEVVDVSPSGLSFQLPLKSKNHEGIELNKEMTFRFYFTEDTFIPIGVKILNKRQCLENGDVYIRYGCSVDSSFQSFEAFKAFSTFLRTYAESCQADKEDLKLFFF